MKIPKHSYRTTDDQLAAGSEILWDDLLPYPSTIIKTGLGSTVEYIIEMISFIKAYNMHACFTVYIVNFNVSCYSLLMVYREC